MNLEDNIKSVIDEKMKDGTVEKLIGEQLEKGITNALDNLFRSYGDITKIIEEQVKSVMVPFLESYDYSEYIVKLDSVLVDVLKNSALENKTLLHNFKELMTVDPEKSIKLTDLFEIWKEYVAKEVETNGLEIDYDDRPSYESVHVRFEVIEDESSSWSSFDYANVIFECEHDEKMNFAIRISRFNKKDEWDIEYRSAPDISSLRHLNDFEILLMRLTQNRTNLIIDEYHDNDSVTPGKEPEPHFE